MNRNVNGMKGIVIVAAAVTSTLAVAVILIAIDSPEGGLSVARNAEFAVAESSSVENSVELAPPDSTAIADARVSDEVRSTQVQESRPIDVDLLSSRELRSVFDEVSEQRKVLRSELNLLTADAYNDAFDRGEFVELRDTKEAGDISGKLVSFRFVEGGKILFTTLPREGFEYAYSVKNHLDQIEQDFHDMKAAITRSDKM